MDLLRRIASEQQAAIICVTHDETIFNRFDRVFYLRDGRLVSTSRNTAGFVRSKTSAETTMGIQSQKLPEIPSIAERYIQP